MEGYMFSLMAEAALETPIVRVLKANGISTLLLTRWLLALAVTANLYAQLDAAQFENPNWN